MGLWLGKDFTFFTVALHVFNQHPVHPMIEQVNGMRRLEAGEMLES